MKKYLIPSLLLFFILPAPLLYGADCQAIKKSLKAERNLKKKRELLGKAIVQCPDDAVLNFKYGLSLERFRKYDQALRYYGKAIKLQPEFGKAYLGRGDVLIYQEKLEEAISAYQRGLIFSPENSRYQDRLLRLKVKRKAINGGVLSVQDVVKVMDQRSKISTSSSLLLTGPVIQYRIAFQGGTEKLQPTGIRQLAAVGQAMMTESLNHLSFEIEVHAVAVDSNRSLEISKARAELIKSRLVDNFGIRPERLEISWYGDTQPLVENEVNNGRNLNQRVEIKRK
ncbi:MAG: OmpA family protein [Thermodesulfobacteriota bacterium]